MRRIQVLLISLLISILMISPACKSCKSEPQPPPYGDEVVLNVLLYAQQTNMWCWAATAEMIMSYHGEEVPQCTQVTNQAIEHGKDINCCDIPTPEFCVQGSWPEYERYGFTFSSTPDGTALSWDQLKEQIDSNKPVGFCWKWRGSGDSGHFMVAKGYMIAKDQEPPSDKWVAINDPWPYNQNKYNGGAQKLITYNEYVSSSNHTHWLDNYNITRKKSN